MKNILKYVVSIALAFMIIVTAAIPPVEAGAKGVTLSKSIAVMEKDSSLKLKVSGTDSKVTWSTSKKSVATVTSAGTVKAKKEGKATITASVDGYKLKCSITVKDSNKAAEGEKLIVDQDGVKIYSRGLSAPKSAYQDGYVLNIRVENNRDKGIMIQARDISANGYVTSVIFSLDVPAGKKALDEIKFYDNGIVSDIDGVDEVELKFDVMDQKTWNDIFISDAISIIK